MTALLFRSPSLAEIDQIRARWCDGLGARTTSIPTVLGPDRYIRIGKFHDTGVSPKHWFRMHRALVDELTANAGEGGTRLEAVAFEGIPDAMLGWSCAELEPEGTVVHWVSVDRKLGRHGLGRALLDRVFEAGERKPLRLSHITPLGAMLIAAWQRHNPHAPPAWSEEPRP